MFSSVGTFVFSVSVYFWLPDSDVYAFIYYFLFFSSFYSLSFSEIMILFCEPFSRFLLTLRTGDSSLFYDKEVSKWVVDVTGAMLSLWLLVELTSWWSDSD